MKSIPTQILAVVAFLQPGESMERQRRPVRVLAECVVLEIDDGQFSQLSKQRFELNTKWYVRVCVIFFINWTFSKAIENMCIIVIPEA